MRHLKEQGMSYFEHLFHAWSMAGALFIHGLFPQLFTDYATNKINCQKH